MTFVSVRLNFNVDETTQVKLIPVEPFNLFPISIIQYAPHVHHQTRQPCFTMGFLRRRILGIPYRINSHASRNGRAHAAPRAAARTRHLSIGTTLPTIDIPSTTTALNVPRSIAQSLPTSSLGTRPDRRPDQIGSHRRRVGGCSPIRFSSIQR